jgi:PAS domain S-box-containing protein
MTSGVGQRKGVPRHRDAAPDPDILRVLQGFISFAVLFAIAAGLLGVLGWLLGIAVFKSVIPGGVIIKPNAAVALVLCGSSLWLLRSAAGKPPEGTRRTAGRALASMVAAIGLLSLSEHLVGWDLGIDQILFRDPDPWEAFGSVRRGLMAPLTALDFLLVGLALLYLDSTVTYRSERLVPSQVLAFAANTGAIVGLLDLLLGSRTAYTVVALQTATALFVLSFAVVCARTDEGLGALLVSSSYGGMLTRWLWPAAIVIPLLIGSASWMGYSAGLLSVWTGITAMMVSMVTLLAGLAVWTAGRVDRSDLQRRQAEEALRGSEASLNKAQEIAHIGSWHLDVGRNQLAWSDEVFRIFGIPAGTPLTYESFLGLIHPADRDAVDKAWTAAMAGAPYDIEHRVLVGGAPKWVRERAEIEFDREGHALQGTGTVQDITERKRAQNELLRVNRALRALSLCNQALIRATDESAWLDQICRIIIEAAGYRFCWVGRAEHDEAKGVTVLARSGIDEGYLENVGVTWADSERGRGPVGTCIRTGRTAIVRDTATDPGFAIWRAEALKRGYASVIAIPLAVAAETFGALAIYAAEPDVFSDEEVSLLTELADDLAFGIGALQNETERKKAEEEIRTLNVELEARVRARTADLEAAREREATIGFRIQQMLLLTQPPTDVPGVQVAAVTMPSQRIDGDFYDFFRHSNDCLDVIVADVMGKGIPAALLAGATKSNVLEALCHLLALSCDRTLPEPREIVTLAHADMVRQLIDLESFVTLCYARVDLQRRVVTLVDCGHTGMLVVRDGSQVCEAVHGNNLPLGISLGEIFDQLTVPFEAGDLFLFYSDGVTDIRNPAGELFGSERLADCVLANRQLEPAALVETIRRAAMTFAQSDRLNDDLTCVAVRAGVVPQPLVRSAVHLRSDLAELGRARDFVRDFCRAVPEGLVRDSDAAGLELAVNEAVSNIIKHGCRGRADQPIQLDAEAFADRVSIRLHYLGDSFDPRAVPPPALDGSRESGFGLYLITRSVDDVRYSRDERGRNSIMLVKRLDSPVPGAMPCS